MITYSKIGHFGRLGNQLFQFASTIGIARKAELEVVFPIENVTNSVVEHFKDGKVLNITFDIPKVFNLNKNIIVPKSELNIKYTINEPHFHFDSTLFEKISDNTDLTGYYQSEKYFKHIQNELYDLLTFKDDIKEKAINIFPKVAGNTVSIHIRRGDYVYLQQFHPLCTNDYYIKAANIFENINPYFIIFSDDITYCKELFGNSENILYIDNVDPYVDLCLMSMCDHNIIANSSCSWWGAWLNKNKNKKVVAPKQWFGPAYSHDTKDLYCKNWIVL